MANMLGDAVTAKARGQEAVALCEAAARRRTDRRGFWGKGDICESMRNGFDDSTYVLTK